MTNNDPGVLFGSWSYLFVVDMCLVGSVGDHRSLPPEFESWHGPI